MPAVSYTDLVMIMYTLIDSILISENRSSGFTIWISTW